MPNGKVAFWKFTVILFLAATLGPMAVLVVFKRIIRFSPFGSFLGIVFFVLPCIGFILHYYYYYGYKKYLRERKALFEPWER
jgi:hypothetical protein